jgi:hypothetical protein
MNKMQSMRLSSVVTIIYAGYKVTPLQAFLLLSMGKLPLHRTIGFWGATTSTFAIFQDDDCEDLCDSFGLVPSVPFLTKVNEDDADRMVTSSVAAPRTSRRSRALWWADPGPDKCLSCQSEGVMICRFCGGTSMMSAIGGETDTLFYDGIGKDCPVCDDGLEACNKCAGTGWVFSWSKDRNRTDSVYP